MNTYFLSDVVAVVNVNRSTLQQWLKDGYVSAKIPGDGPGTRNLFDADDVCRIALFKKLSGIGLSRELAAAVSGRYSDGQHVGITMNVGDATVLNIDSKEIEADIKKSLAGLGKN